MTDRPADAEIAHVILELCQKRGYDKTICPSEVARSLASDGVDWHWRELMVDVRRVAGQLALEGRIEVCQKGRAVNIDAARGPIRLRLAASSRQA